MVHERSLMKEDCGVFGVVLDNLKRQCISTTGCKHYSIAVKKALALRFMTAVKLMYRKAWSGQ